MLGNWSHQSCTVIRSIYSLNVWCSFAYYRCSSKSAFIVIHRTCNSGSSSISSVVSLAQASRPSIVAIGLVIVVAVGPFNNIPQKQITVLRSFHTNRLLRIFTARAMLYTLYATALCLSVSVCPSQVGVLLKWLNVRTRKQRRTISQGL